MYYNVKRIVSVVRGNVHKVTDVFWPKKYCALKALSENLFVLEEKLYGY